ncbi:VOC family protein [Geodermatophilus sp. URMC 63]
MRLRRPRRPRALAEEAGARRLGGYTEPHEDVRIHADPDGHPFCLFMRPGER